MTRSARTHAGPREHQRDDAGMVKVVLSKRDVELATSHVRFVGDGPQASSGPRRRR
jgi:hypothetical protein